MAASQSSTPTRLTEALAGNPVVLVGAGNMGRAMLEGWIAGGLTRSGLCVVDPAADARAEAVCASAGLAIAASLDAASSALSAAGAIVVLAVKPHQIVDLVGALAPHLAHNSLLVSVAAGVRLATYEKGLPPGRAVVRAMPNTPASVGAGMTVLLANAAVTAQQKAQATALMDAIGAVDWIEDEALMHAVTGVSGSGPGYLFHVVECLAAAGVANGLAPDLAVRLARQTVAGAGQLLTATDTPAAQLRSNVTSPNGTTQAGLEALRDNAALERLFTDAVTAAARRSRELAEP